MIRKAKNIAHLLLAVLANLVYGFPGRKLKVIGVTGTDGKTTTASLICFALNRAGRKAAMITTVGAVIDGRTEDIGVHVTTPSSFAIQKFLRRAVRTGHEFAVIETSSHGIDQNRVWGVPYRVAVITNITSEHLDYHRTFAEYARVKFRFLNSAATAVVNADDPQVMSLLGSLRARAVTYSRTADADYTPAKFPFQTRLFGEFNRSNALAAIAALRQFSVPEKDIRSALADFRAPLGRQDIVHDGRFRVMVDFAHTPNSIETLLREVRATGPKRIIHLFGAPGRRDQGKRPLMGQASAEFSDIIILTADDPRDERVEDINRQIKEGIGPRFEANRTLYEIPDRREAIRQALALAQDGDFIVLTGKGHEAGLAMAHGEVPWNEREIVLDILGGK